MLENSPIIFISQNNLLFVYSCSNHTNLNINSGKTKKMPSMRMEARQKVENIMF
jgi:hypothetical protein